jgi:hypothetical protein
MKYDIWNRHSAFNVAIFADAERRIALRIRTDIAFDSPVNVAAALEMQVPVDLGVGANERIHNGVPAFFSTKHVLLQCACSGG